MAWKSLTTINEFICMNALITWLQVNVSTTGHDNLCNEIIFNGAFIYILELITPTPWILSAS